MSEQQNDGLQDSDLSELVWWASVDSHTDQTIFLYRKEGGQWSLLDKLSVDEETMPTLEDFKFSVKELHGGGIYEAAIRTPKGQLAKRIHFSLSGLPKRPEEKPVEAAKSTTDNSLEQIIGLLAQQNQQTQQMLLTGLEKLGEKIAQKPEIDPFVFLERASNILGKAGATPAPQKSLVEQITELKTAADLIGLGGLGGTGEDSWGSLAAALVPLTEMMKENTINERLKLKLAKKSQEQKAQAQQAQAKQTAAPINSQATLMAEFKPVLTQILPLAEQNQDPVAVAEAILKIAPDHNQLNEFLRRDDALAIMADLEPKVTDYWDWFTYLANAMLEKIEAQQVQHETGKHPKTTVPITNHSPQPQATNSNGQQGSTANATDNGAIGKTRARKSANTANGITAS